MDKKQVAGIRQSNFIERIDEKPSSFFLVQFYDRERFSYSQVVEQTSQTLKKECHTETLQMDVRNADNLSLDWILYACPAKKRSGWFLTVVADSKTIAQYSLETFSYPISAKDREYLKLFPQRFMVFCNAMDKDCEKAIANSGKKDWLVALLPTFLDSPMGTGLD